MTIFFPDISSYEAGLTIQPGTVAVIAKATEGTYYEDKQYASFKAQAAHVGAIFSAYHFLKAGDGVGQADYCHAMVGSTPVMLDVETEGTSKPTVDDCIAFVNRTHDLGGRTWAAYFPEWFWQQVGGNLALLTALGVNLVSSNYTAYSDAGPGWAPYGGTRPMIWQYTNAQAYGGQSIDFNAFRGTVAELAALINGTTIPTPSTGGTDMPYTVEAGWQRDYPDVAAALQQHIPTGTVLDVDHASAYGALRSFVAAERTATIEQKLDQVLTRLAAPAPVDVAALSVALVPHLNAGATADQIAVAVVNHLGLQVVAK